MFTFKLNATLGAIHKIRPQQRGRGQAEAGRGRGHTRTSTFGSEIKHLILTFGLTNNNITVTPRNGCAMYNYNYISEWLQLQVELGRF